MEREVGNSIGAMLPMKSLGYVQRVRRLAGRVGVASKFPSKGS